MNNIPTIKEIEPKQRHTRNCKCTQKCAKYFRVDGMDVYCKGVMQQLAITILNEINGTFIVQGNQNQRGWTTKQENEIIKYIKKNGVEFGTYRIIGEMIGKPRESVKRKVYQLREKGKL